MKFCSLNKLGECLSSWSGDVCDILECEKEPEFCSVYFKPSQCDISGITSMCPKVN